MKKNLLEGERDGRGPHLDIGQAFLGNIRDWLVHPAKVRQLIAAKVFARLEHGIDGLARVADSVRGVVFGVLGECGDHLPRVQALVLHGDATLVCALEGARLLNNVLLFQLHILITEF